MRSWWLVFVFALVVATLLTVARPRARGFPRAVARMRQKERYGAGRLSDELADVIEHARARDYVRVRAAIRAKIRFGVHEWSEEKLWALDAAVISLGCTHRTCFVGALGSWWRMPHWTSATDLWALCGLHAVACALHYSHPSIYYRLFAPSASRPLSIPLGAFATSGKICTMRMSPLRAALCATLNADSSPWPTPPYTGVFELLWLGNTLTGLCAQLQRPTLLGRGGFLCLYLSRRATPLDSVCARRGKDAPSSAPASAPRPAQALPCFCSHDVPLSGCVPQCPRVVALFVGSAPFSQRRRWRTGKLLLPRARCSPLTPRDLWSGDERSPGARSAGAPRVRCIHVPECALGVQCVNLRALRSSWHACGRIIVGERSSPFPRGPLVARRSASPPGPPSTAAVRRLFCS